MVLNKNNCNLRKEVKRRMTCEFVPNGGLNNGLGSQDSNNTVTSQNTSNKGTTNNTFFPSLSHFQKMHNIDEVDSDNSVTSNMDDSKSQQSQLQIEINPEIEKLKDQSNLINQLKSIKDFTLQSFKESQRMEKEFEKIKQDLLSNLAKNCICCKHMKPENIKKETSKNIIEINKENSRSNSLEEKEDNDSYKFIKLNNCTENESNRVNFENNTNIDNKSSVNESALKTPKHRKKKIKVNSEYFPNLNINIEERPIDHMILPDSKRRHSSYFNLKTESSLENMWSKYTDVGCASKYFFLN
jgi:hypothetical protein